MGKLISFKNNFTAGELTPSVQGRIDLSQYQNGAIKMENALPRPQGGFRRRPGCQFVARAKYNNKTCRLIPFKFNVTQTYMLELGDFYMRFFSNRSRLEEAAKPIVNATNNGSGAIRLTVNGHGYTTGNHIAIRNVGGTTEANDDWRITVINANTFDLDGSTFNHAYTSGGTASKIIEIATPWSEADLPDIRYAQDADLMLLVHPNFWPRILTRTSPITFTLTQVDNNPASTRRFTGGPFQPINSDKTHTMTPSATTGNITVTSSKPYFSSNMVGMFLRIGGEVSGEQGYVRITGFTSVTQVTATVESTLSGTSATADWALGSWGEKSGFPADVTFFEQRLVFARTRTEPQTLWFSAINDYFDFRVGTADDEPITAVVAAEDVNVINALAAHDAMLIMTQGAEYVLTGGNDNAVTPTNVVVRQQSSYGAEPLKALKMGATVVYVQRGGRRLRDLNFSLEQDRYLTDDLTILADHIFREDPIVDYAFQLTPDPVIWLVSSLGMLVSLTIIKSQKVISWARHPVAKTFVESVGTIPETSVDNDDVWIAGVVGLVNGAKRYIGYLNKDLNADWGLTATFGSPVTSISGLDHLEGEEVVINGDGAVYPPATVVNGRITVNPTMPLMTIEVGLQYIPEVIPTSPEWNLATGPTFGRKKRFNKILVFTNDTMTIEVNGEIKEARDPDDAMGQAPPSTGPRMMQFTSLGSSEIVQLSIRQPLPLDMDVISIYGEVEVGD